MTIRSKLFASAAFPLLSLSLIAQPISAVAATIAPSAIERHQPVSDAGIAGFEVAQQEPDQQGGENPNQKKRHGGDKQQEKEQGGGEQKPGRRQQQEGQQSGEGEQNAPQRKQQNRQVQQEPQGEAPAMRQQPQGDEGQGQDQGGNRQHKNRQKGQQPDGEAQPQTRQQPQGEQGAGQPGEQQQGGGKHRNKNQNQELQPGNETNQPAQQGGVAPAVKQPQAEAPVQKTQPQTSPAKNGEAQPQAKPGQAAGQQQPQDEQTGQKPNRHGQKPGQENGNGQPQPEQGAAPAKPAQNAAPQQGEAPAQTGQQPQKNGQPATGQPQPNGQAKPVVPGQPGDQAQPNGKTQPNGQVQPNGQAHNPQQAPAENGQARNPANAQGQGQAGQRPAPGQPQNGQPQQQNGQAQQNGQPQNGQPQNGQPQNGQPQNAQGQQPANGAIQGANGQAVQDTGGQQVSPQELEHRRQIAKDPSKANGPVILPVQNGTAVLDSQKDFRNGDANGGPAGFGSGNGGHRRPDPQSREYQLQEQFDRLPPPRDDADSQLGPDGRRAPPVRFQDVMRDRGQRMNDRPDFARPDGADIEERQDNRVIFNFDNRTIVRHDDTQRFLDGNERPEYEQLPGNRYREVIDRPNGDRIVTVRNRYGDIIERTRIDGRGRQYVLIYSPDLEDQPDNDYFRDPGEDLPPMRLRIPLNQYIIDSSEDRDANYYDFLREPPVEPVERVYSLNEIRYSARIRDKVRRIDLDTITFATGSSEIPMSQAASLRNVADAISKIVKTNPTETFLIEGHTDAVGTAQSNLILSDQRAESVASVLTNVYGVPPENLVTQGYGEQFLKVNTQGPNQENRRVTVRRVTALVRPVASQQ